MRGSFIGRQDRKKAKKGDDLHVDRDDVCLGGDGSCRADGYRVDSEVPALDYLVDVKSIKLRVVRMVKKRERQAGQETIYTLSHQQPLGQDNGRL